MKKMVLLFVLLSLVISICPAFGFEGACACKKLSEDQLKQAFDIAQAMHPYDCCDKTIAECLDEKPRCLLAVRLANQICRQVARGETKSGIEGTLKKRAMSMMPTPMPAKIDFSKAEIAGYPNAPVTVTLYLCVRCPFCAKFTPWIYKEVTEGSLKGKVKLALRLFPIKGHEGSVESGLALLAAYKQQKAFEYLLYAYKNFDTFSIDALPKWAEAIGLDMAKYQSAVSDPTTRTELVESKKEGISNKVNATPTIFINGRMYRSLTNHEMMLDVLEEEYERVTGKLKES